MGQESSLTHMKRDRIYSKKYFKTIFILLFFFFLSFLPWGDFFQKFWVVSWVNKWKKQLFTVGFGPQENDSKRNRLPKTCRRQGESVREAFIKFHIFRNGNECNIKKIWKKMFEKKGEADRKIKKYFIRGYSPSTTYQHIKVINISSNHALTTSPNCLLIRNGCNNGC